MFRLFPAPKGTALSYDQLIVVQNNCGATLKPGANWSASGQGQCGSGSYLVFSNGGGLPQLAPLGKQTVLDQHGVTSCNDYVDGVLVDQYPPSPVTIVANASAQFVLNGTLFDALGTGIAQVN